VRNGLTWSAAAGAPPAFARGVPAGSGRVADGRCQSRAIRFVIVGAIGFVVQIAALWALTVLGGWRWLPATLVAVEVAVVHNFLWHDRWTWPAGAGSRRSILGRFVAFNLTTGLTSIAGNAALMTVFAALTGLPPIAASALAVAALGALNFTASDRWIFKPLLMTIVIACTGASAAQAAPAPEAIAGWNRYVSTVEARIDQDRISTLASIGAIQIAGGGSGRGSDRRALLPACSSYSGSIRCDGESIGIPSGTISRWRGSVFLRGISLDRLLHALQDPGTPPPQEDIADSRVLSRTADSLQVSIRLVRTAVVTMTYDTEHEMRFQRWTSAFATARSVATRIDEVGGDHGFLWRLNSYWRYLQLNDGVLVELESLSLSRTVPSLLHPIAAPIVTRIARESMVRTLEALRRYVG